MDVDIGELTKPEKELMEQDWGEFKSDVSMKQLINQLDRAIKRRHRLYLSDDPEESARIAEFQKQYKRYKPVKLIALTLYVLLPIMEKPGWCIKNAELLQNPDQTSAYWFCQNTNKTIANSNIPKLPALATNLIYLVCLAILFAFTKARDYYRKRDDRGDTVTLQLWLMAIAAIDLLITITVISIGFSQTTRDNSFFV